MVVVVVVVAVGYCDREMSEFDGGVDKRREEAATAKDLLEDKDDRRVGKDLMVLTGCPRMINNLTRLIMNSMTVDGWMDGCRLN